MKDLQRPQGDSSTTMSNCPDCGVSHNPEECLLEATITELRDARDRLASKLLTLPPVWGSTASSVPANIYQSVGPHTHTVALPLESHPELQVLEDLIQNLEGRRSEG